MSRVKRGVTTHARHAKIRKAAKGYYGRRKNVIRVAKQAVDTTIRRMPRISGESAFQYSFRPVVACHGACMGRRLSMR